MAKVEKCVVINPPVTAEEQEAFDRKVARALAVALFRSFEREKTGGMKKNEKQRSR
jgi:hypothetical protein